MKTLKRYLSNPYVALVLGMLFMIFSSAKWTIFIAPWFGLAFLLYFSRNVKLWQVLVFGVLGLYISGLLAVYEVFPAPLPIFMIILMIVSLKSIIPYLIDKLSKAKEKGFLGTLIFPAAFISLEYLNTLESGDVWSSIANTQYQFKAIQQIASVFGIWGISFLVAWFASLFNWMTGLNWEWKKIKRGVAIAATIYVVVLAFGIFRLAFSHTSADEYVKIAGVTLDNTNVMETLYEDEFGKTIRIKPETSQASPELQEANKAMIPFIENPADDKYKRTLETLEGNLELLFQKTALLADEGAKIVVWSEAISLIINNQEESVIQRAKELAREKGIYLFISLGVINPGPYSPDRLLLVNKTMTLTPEGELANTYLKSNPVPFAEQDYGSDDIMPVIDTPYGKLSPVICYDADFPHFMKQAGSNKTDILLIPSGDWKAIDPYHAQMAVLRGIENGVSIVRPVSRATSLATDPYGNIIAKMDFFSSADKTIIANVKTRGVATIYNTIGDVLPYLSLVLTAYIILDILFRAVLRRKKSYLKGKTRALET